MAIFSTYKETYDFSLTQPEGFWKVQAEKLEWFKSPTQILTKKDDHHYQWFADGEMNTSYLALDYHVKNGRGEQLALIYDSPVTSTKKTYTYTKLHNQVARPFLF